MGREEEGTSSTRLRKKMQKKKEDSPVKGTRPSMRRSVLSRGRSLDRDRRGGPAGGGPRGWFARRRLGPWGTWR
jgi:hypothetical protein